MLKRIVRSGVTNLFAGGKSEVASHMIADDQPSGLAAYHSVPRYILESHSLKTNTVLVDHALRHVPCSGRINWTASCRHLMPRVLV
jgi:hypothetical protein